ncbi:unnamed protein product [Cuscuta europaea]|uniref:Thioredoxin domain-containing protein n=1 Tax=Cuscuta europaea TaxID=41803 RepID=A0A9P0ZGU1_CUSEU|nr:unnamed protein product [Cuscuta europaea]
MRMGNIFTSLCFLSKLWSTNDDDDDDDDSCCHVNFSGGNVTLITTKESWEQKIEEARKDNKIVIANFSASWCRPCKMIAPFYCELSEKQPSLRFLVVDVDELSDLSSSWEVKATPTFFFIKDGKKFDSLLGANKTELENKITTIIDSKTPCQP